MLLVSSPPTHNTMSPIVPYQVFCAITNFVRDNGDDWERFHANPPYSTIAHPITFQAFQDITTFIHNNGFDWDKFCTSTTSQQNLSPKTLSPTNVVAINNSLPLAPEPLLQKNPHRFVLFPIQHPNIWRMYMKAKASFWTVEEIDLATDIVDWAHLSDNKRHFLSHVLAMFAASDGIVNKNLCHNFATKCC